MRSLFLAALLLVASLSLVLTAPSAPALAEDGPEIPLVKVPTYGIPDIAPAKEERPPGWSPVTQSGVIPKGAPTVGALLAIARKANIGSEHFAVRSLPFQRGEGEKREAVLLTLVAVNENPAAFTSAVADAAVDGGWVAREMGSPMRVMLLWGSSKQAAHEVRDWLVGRVMLRTCKNAFDKVVASQQQQSRALYVQGVELINRARAIEPDAGVYHALRARMLQGRNDAAALASYRRALAKDVIIPPPAKWKVLACARLGQMLLNQAKKEDLPEALAVLEAAVALEKHNASPIDRFGARYNLACTHVRMGTLEAAFALLDTSLAYARKHLGTQYPFHFVHARDKDPDMAPLRKDERFAKIMAKYDPDAAAAKPAAKPGETPEEKPEEKKDR